MSNNLLLVIIPKQQQRRLSKAFILKGNTEASLSLRLAALLSMFIVPAEISLLLLLLHVILHVCLKWQAFSGVVFSIHGQIISLSNVLCNKRPVRMEGIRRSRPLMRPEVFHTVGK